MKRLPRDPEEQKIWARRLVVGLNVPPLAVFLYQGESFRQAYQRIFCRAYELGARAGLNELLGELERSDNPLAGLPPHLVKSARAAARARRRKAAKRDRRCKAA
ncbi:MAG: hypothetical protein IMF16_03690 [Proteobacteria bacterium]|nr:hypothetical protein [Pseudomonadota bacterium]